MPTSKTKMYLLVALTKMATASLSKWMNPSLGSVKATKAIVVKRNSNRLLEGVQWSRTYSWQTLRHETVNHAKEFKTAAGVHTNTIEGTWNGIKSIIKARHRTAPIMNYRLAEFIFRRKHAGDFWGGIIKALKEVSFDKVTSSDDIDEEFIYTEVKRERSDLDHDDSEFNDNTQWETDTEDDDDTSGEYTADSHRKRPRGQ
ncbi:hypothetical protein O0I10_013066 [Lichtheimia ornata]|uniref:ISXO2-like transposase domain-containing protein n=1 Tax=Lichtheimia ornata TaxID=688661 RepID=A0AAD7XSK5_9FUNG|nr:uncharacterized protein O0I10_013066 [Lichtheimia ornata]KAJ8651396.1 hypothetical protein O0I10_013066 [Lichtheimia ornata]